MSAKEILEIVIKFLLLPILLYFVRIAGDYVAQRIKEWKEKTQNDKTKNMLSFIDEVISISVSAVNQTFVEALKKDNLFDEAAQKEALEMALKIVFENLTKEATDYIDSVTGDFDAYVIPRIESEVKTQKVLNEL